MEEILFEFKDERDLRNQMGLLDAYGLLKRPKKECVLFVNQLMFDTLFSGINTYKGHFIDIDNSIAPTQILLSLTKERQNIGEKKSHLRFVNFLSKELMSGKVSKEMKELVNKLNFYRNEYYNKHNSVITDKEYDELYDKLVELEKSTGVVLSNSPTQTVGYPILIGLQKIKHSHKMLSLEKTKSIDVFQDFINKTYCMLSLKLDGLTVLLTYENGELVQAETRGDGEVGQLITEAAKHFINIPLKVPFKNHFEIEGEAIVTYDDFEEINKEKIYKNPRNYASGSLSLLDMNEFSKRKIRFVAWKVITDTKDILNVGPIKTGEKFSSRLEQARSYGFDIVPYYIVIGKTSLLDKMAELRKDAKDLKYPIDGLVCTINNVRKAENAGETAHAPRHSLAYKFYDEEYESKLLDVTYEPSRNGVLTPVAIIEPVEIDGTIIERCSMHNLSIMKNTLHGFGWRGQNLKIIKSNCIIPQIASAEIPFEDNIEFFNLIDKCPSCGNSVSVTQNNNTEILSCSNKDCKLQLVNQLDYFCGKTALDIKGLSKKTIESIYALGILNEKKDIFNLCNHKDKLLKMPGFANKKVSSLLDNIENAKNITLERVIVACGIREIGPVIAKILIEHYDTWEAFRKETDFTHIEGIGSIMSDIIVNFDYSEMDYIVENYLNITKNNVIINNIKDNRLEGKIFAITGSLLKDGNFKNRSVLENDIISKGGKVYTRIVDKVDYLIANKKENTTKYNAAVDRGIKIITEREYEKL